MFRQRIPVLAITLTLMIMCLLRYKQSDKDMKQMQIKFNIPEIQGLLDDVTVATAYVNIGSFKKGSSHKTYTTETYHRWMKVFKSIRNPVVAFFDNKKDAEIFRTLRKDGQKLNRTLVHIFQRNDTWSFSLIPKIKSIISQPGYPKHRPNTVVPEYQSIQHLKYEIMSNISKTNPFHTKYIAWVDIGLFRHLTQSNDVIKPFNLYIPPGYDVKKIAYNQVTQPLNVTNKEIFYKNMYWVCGCFFIGHVHTMLKWTAEYIRYTVLFLYQGLANTDQRVVYAMQRNEQPSVQIQPYIPKGRHNIWFDLGYVCKKQGEYRS